MADRIDELLSRLVPLKGPDVPTPPVRYRSDDPSSSQALSPLPPARYEQPEWNEDSEVRLNRLQEIGRSIESMVVSKPSSLPADRKWKIDYPGELNERQLAAVLQDVGPVLVIAGAGSGKTRTIVYRVAYLVERGVPPERILLLTFTRKAAQEMLSRVGALLREESVQRVMGGTFHAFANSMLRRYAPMLSLSPRFSIVDTADSEEIIDLIRHELHLEKKEKAFPRKNRLQEIISRARNLQISVADVIRSQFKGLLEYITEIETIDEAYRRYKKQNQVLDYDDLLETFLDNLKENVSFRGKIQEHFPFILVDEYQDTNAVQKEILDVLASRDRNIMVVGDDSQSIYAFRGARFENILRFPESYPDCRVVKLEQNYRSTQPLLDFTNNLIAKARIGFPKTLFSLDERPGKPKVELFFNQEDEAEFIVAKILELRERDVPLSEMAVLYRAGYHGNFVQAELLKRSIPYVVYGGIRFAERRHIKDMVAYLRVLFNPFDAIAWNRILKLLPGIGPATARRIIDAIQLNRGRLEGGEISGKKGGEELKKLARILQESSPDSMPVVKKLEHLKGYYLPILKTLEDDYENRVMDIDVLMTLAVKYDDRVERFLTDLALDPPSQKFQDRNTPLVDETEEKPLVLSTVHSAKGLEWNTVFVPHLLDGLFPSTKSLNSWEDLEEERRLFYVACTRAKERLYLTFPSLVGLFDAFFTHPSRFLAEIDPNHYEYRNSARL